MNQPNALEAIPALHEVFFALGAITSVSSLTFLQLHPHDGNNISRRDPQPAGVSIPRRLIPRPRREIIDR